MNIVANPQFDAALPTIGKIWKKCRLGDIAEKFNSGLSQGGLQLQKDGYPVFGASGLIGLSPEYHMEEPFIGIVKDGAGVGNTMSCPANSSAIGTLDCLVGRNGCSTDFLGILLPRLNLKKYQSGSTIPHIYFSDYKSIAVSLPSPEEQHRICSAFEAIDAKIMALRDKANALEDYKRGITQKLCV